MPSERSLTATLGVNRHVVREALGRLEQVGLIRITQGGATRVLDFRRSAGLDLLVLIADHAQALEEALPLLAHCLELRATIGGDVARLAADRATGSQRADIAAAADMISRAAPEEQVLLDRRFWQLLLDSAGNLAYQLAFNSLIRAVDRLGPPLAEYLVDELAATDHRRPIAAAVCAADAEAAESAARAALRPRPELARFGGTGRLGVLESPDPITEDPPALQEATR